MKIVHSVHILPDAVRLDGVALPVEEQGAELPSIITVGANNVTEGQQVLVAN